MNTNTQPELHVAYNPAHAEYRPTTNGREYFVRFTDADGERKIKYTIADSEADAINNFWRAIFQITDPAHALFNNPQPDSILVDGFTTLR